jgi:hypothetical protein
MTPILRTAFIFALAVAPHAAATQQRPAVRPLGPVVATASEPIGGGFGAPSVRALTNGNVLVNDVAGRRVLLFDSTLTTFTVVADSTSATANAYGGRIAGLVPYHGDSTLFIDPASMSMLVMDPAGKVGRVISVPRSQDAMALAGGPMGGAGFDPRGALVYRISGMFRMAAPAGAAGGAPPMPPEQPDSAAIVRVDLATRRVDTIAFTRTPKINFQVNRREDGTVEMSSQINPLPTVDEWALLPDGSVAIVRGSDYRVDFVSPDGSRRSSPKIPFDWQRLSDEDKVAFIDSVKVARERLQASGGAGASALGVGGGPMIMMREGPGAGAGGARARGTPGRGSGNPPQLSFVPPEELPDYKPPFFPGAVRADAEGNLWVRTIPTQAIAGGPVYDVINSAGELVERVQIPEGRTIIGFGPQVVYLSHIKDGRTVMERATIR